MTTFFFSAWLSRLKSRWQSAQRPSLSAPGQLDEKRLPRFVRESAVALKYLRLLGPLDWDRFPDRPDQRFSLDCPPCLMRPSSKLTYVTRPLTSATVSRSIPSISLPGSSRIIPKPTSSP